MAADDVTITSFAYQDGDTDLIGLVARPAGEGRARAGVLVVPAVFGINKHPRDRARRLAELGYVAFVVDLYGGGRNFASLEQAMRAGGAIMADVGGWRARLEAALSALRAEPDVDSARIAAIGFCIGGTSVLELAYAGADLAAVISFHGGLRLSDPEGSSRVKGSVLICTGGNDPLVSDADIQEVERQLRKSAADWQVEIYGNARHAFTDTAADGFGTPVAGYSEVADRRSWQSMESLLAERLK